MSVLRRLYNVAAGKVRAWQAGERLHPELESELRAVREPAVARRERWSPPFQDFGEDASADLSDGEASDPPAERAAPRKRRL